MLLSEIGYMILEQIRSNRIVDDEEIDMRLIYDWIKMKRADILKNKANNGQEININNAQSATYGVSEVSTYTGEKSTLEYFCNVGRDYTIFKSTSPIPNILFGYTGPLVMEVTSDDLAIYPFSFVPFGQLRFSGNGKFTKGLVYCALDIDEHIYIEYNREFINRPNFVIKAVFEDPTSVLGFDVNTDRYPCSLDVIEAIKLSVFDKDFKMLLAAPEESDSNDSNDVN